MKINLTGLGCFGIVLIILAVLAINVLAVPYLLMLVLSAFGVKVGFWVCCGIWVLLVILLNIIK